MVEHTAATTTIQATVEQCFAVGVDVQTYPDWVDNLSAVSVERWDERNRPEIVRFQAEGLGRQSRYVLAYDLSEAPNQLAWSLVEGDLAREIEGRYVFTDQTEQDGPPVDRGPVRADHRSRSAPAGVRQASGRGQDRSFGPGRVQAPGRATGGRRRSDLTPTRGSARTVGIGPAVVGVLA